MELGVYTCNPSKISVVHDQPCYLSLKTACAKRHNLCQKTSKTTHPNQPNHTKTNKQTNPQPTNQQQNKN